MIALQKIGASALYRPIGVMKPYVFLPWQATTPLPSTIAIADTWADAGLPAFKGYSIFLSRFPPNGSGPAAALEANLRAVFTEPETTSFGWFDLDGGAKTVVPLVLADDSPVIAHDTDVMLPDDEMPFVFAAGLSVVATRDDSGEMRGLLMTMPRPASLERARGITIDFVGPRGGAIHFLGALESPVSGDSATGESTTKQLADVFIEPIVPIDGTRIHVEPLGIHSVLSGTGPTGYTFLPA